MKRNDARDFCILYLEPGDDRDALFRAIAGQHKPVVLMLAEQSQLFQRPEEFVALKHLKRQLDVPIFFVIANAGPGAWHPQGVPLHLTHQLNMDRALDCVSAEMKGRLAERNGFPVYKSMLLICRPCRYRRWHHPYNQFVHRHRRQSLHSRHNQSRYRCHNPLCYRQHKRGHRQPQNRFCRRNRRQRKAIVAFQRC